MSKKIKIIINIICTLVVLSVGFFSATIISKFRYTKRISKLEQIIRDGNVKSELLSSELEQRIRELDGFREQAKQVDESITESIGIIERTGTTLNELGTTVDELRVESSDIGTTIRNLKEGQRRIRNVFEELSSDNKELEGKIRQLQESINKQ